ncbi:hypothetical protein [Streptomyces sp. NBC_00347]|uniref:hypothetical protein n=1 Tax=Streptomyces sp. NBC_00347 TaxID=2975721 RepID=UPI002259A609|nr:hypothetical protein [Streptomyces sp. NBC_00347]MCX5125372.1 hypothetical protein [Streptomyces sp. NBC_00347]
MQEQLKSKGPTILMHDGGGDRSQSGEALEKLLPWLKELLCTNSIGGAACP